MRDSALPGCAGEVLRFAVVHELVQCVTHPDGQ